MQSGRGSSRPGLPYPVTKRGERRLPNEEMTTSVGGRGPLPLPIPTFVLSGGGRTTWGLPAPRSNLESRAVPLVVAAAFAVCSPSLVGAVRALCLGFAWLFVPWHPHAACPPLLRLTRQEDPKPAGDQRRPAKPRAVTDNSLAFSL
jgi:hypothetical protein